MAKKVQTGLKLPPELFQAAKEKAAEDHRTFNNLIEVLLDEYLKGKKKPKK